MVKDFILQFYPTEIVEDLGGAGLMAIFNFIGAGPTVVIRCELDALPIAEQNQFDHKSVNPEISHKCGHDGHMAIVAGLIFWIRDQKFRRGKIALLFQPAEETGQGARAVVADSRFEALNPDFVFALHNLPGHSKHQILLKSGATTCSVISLAIYLEGKTCHASEPEHGVNPAQAIAEILDGTMAFQNAQGRDSNFAIITPIHLAMGNKWYGISPGEGEVHFTMRTLDDESMKKLKGNLSDLTKRVSDSFGLQVRWEWLEYFPATHNHPDCVKVVREAAIKNGLDLQTVDLPFRFGEDFGWFSKSYPSCFFGLGAGFDVPALHHADYDFPDDIIPTGQQIFQGIIEQILQRNS